MTDSNGTALATMAFEPTNVDSAMVLAGHFAASKLMPRALPTREAIFAVIVAGRELGLTAMQSIRAINIIDGKTVLGSDLIVAQVRRSPACEYWRITAWTEHACTIETKRPEDKEPTALTWTMADAQRAGLASRDNWRKYPRAMLRARCQAELARAVYPEQAMGLYDPDEMMSDRAPVPVVAEVVTTTSNAPSPVGAGVSAPPTSPPADSSSEPGTFAEVVASAGISDAEMVVRLKRQIADASTPALRAACRAEVKRFVRDQPLAVVNDLRSYYLARHGRGAPKQAEEST